MKKTLLLHVLCLFSALLFAQNLTDSLKAYYNFSGNAQDQSGYGQHGIVHNAVLTPDRFGNPNSAYYFNGNGAYIDIPTSAQMRPTTFPVSFSVWVKYSYPNSPSGTIFQSDNYAGSADYHGYWMILEYGTAHLVMNYGGNGPCSSGSRRSKVGNSSITDNQWHLLVGVVRGPTDMDLYVDCVNDGGSYSGSGNGLFYSSANIAKIGAFHCSGSDYYFKGYIDEMRFYHRALTQADVNALYNYPTPTNSGNMANNILGQDKYLCAGQTLNLNANTSWGSTYSWSNGSTSSNIAVNQPGTYWVDIIGAGCGQHGRDTIEIMSGLDIDVIADTAICKGQTLTLDATPNFVSYSWSTGATSQSIFIANGGTFYVNLTPAVGCTLVDTVVVANGGNPPFINFSNTFQNGNMIQFTNQCVYVNSYSWYFDGVLDTSVNPLHYFPCNIPTTVMLIGSNDCGRDTLTKTLTYYCDGIEALNEKMGLIISPVPATEKIELAYELLENTAISLRIYDEMGREVFSKPSEMQMGEVKTEISVANLPNGIYFLHLVTEKGTLAKKIQVLK